MTWIPDLKTRVYSSSRGLLTILCWYGNSRSQSNGFRTQLKTHWDYWPYTSRTTRWLKSLEVFDKGRCNDCFLLVERVYNSRSKSAVQISYFPKYIPLFFIIMTITWIETFYLVIFGVVIIIWFCKPRFKVNFFSKFV